MTSGFDKVCVVGLGYVGLPTAAVIASRGVTVFGADVNESAVALINQGKIHVAEPGLEMLVQGVVATGNLTATSQPESADAFIIAVPTPFTGAHTPDISYVMAAADGIAPLLEPGNLVIIESTCPVGTTELISARLAELRTDLSFPHDKGETADVKIAHVPERVLPGRILVELTVNDRIVGGVAKNCAARAADLYRLFSDGKIILTDAKTAELAKLAENAYRDVNIAFANELSLVCERFGLDIWETIELTNRHPRVEILNPGPGVGGHCISVDPWFIVSNAPEQTPLMRTARTVNDGMPAHIVDKVRAAMAEISTPQIACLGMAYKANTNDLRESPAVAVIEELAKAKDRILVVEPYISALPDTLSSIESVTLVPLEEAMEHADIVVLLVDHREFRQIDRALLEHKKVIDTRGIWRAD